MAEPSQARSVATLEKILLAAEAVVAREGVAGLTMDGVAQAAGISKGGVLHHFRAKEALIARLATRKLEKLRTDVEGYVAAREGEPHTTLSGMVDHAVASYGRDDGFSRAMLMAAVENSQSLDLFRRLFADTFERVRQQSGDPDAATALLFAVIGIQVARTLELADLDPAEAGRVFEAVRAMASDLPPPASPSG